MFKTEELATLIRFRQELYDSLGLRQDSLFELVDAVLTAAHRSTLVRLSLTATFRRLWSSTCDALADGSVDVTALRTLFTRTLADSAVVDGRPLWVIDGTNWPRPAARASADRTWEYRPLPGWPQSGIVPAWAYQWLVAVPDVAGSWVLPLDVQRRGPTAKSATQVALDQIAAVREAQAPGAPRPVVTLDSGYDLETLAHSTVDADLLVRLAKHRVVYRAPERHPGRGRPRLHGEAISAGRRRHAWPAAAVDPTDPRCLWRSPYRRLDRSPRGWCAGRSLQCGARPGRAPAQQTAATSAFVAGLDRGSTADLPERAVALVFAPVHRRARVPLLQADARLDYRPPSKPGSSRSLELADRCRLLATVVGSSTGQRRPHAMGTSPT